MSAFKFLMCVTIFVRLIAAFSPPVFNEIILTVCPQAVPPLVTLVMVPFPVLLLSDLSREVSSDK